MRKILSLLLCLMLLPALLVQADTALVLDYANLIDSQREAELEARAQEFEETYGLKVAILTMATIKGSSSAEAFADDFFERNYGTDGVLFLLDMDSRSWHISTYGKALELLDDVDLMEIEDAVISCFSAGQYYEGFDQFLTMLPGLLSQEEASLLWFLLICAVPGAILAAIILAVMIWAMNSKKKQHSASDYTVSGSYKLRSHQDLFLYSDLSKRAKPKDDKKSDTTTTHKSSSGRTHGGRGGKF